MNNFSLLLIFKTKFQKLFKGIQTNLTSHYDTKYIPTDVCVHPLLMGKLKNLWTYLSCRWCLLSLVARAGNHWSTIPSRSAIFLWWLQHGLKILEVPISSTRLWTIYFCHMLSCNRCSFIPCNDAEGLCIAFQVPLGTGFLFDCWIRPSGLDFCFQ